MDGWRRIEWSIWLEPGNTGPSLYSSSGNPATCSAAPAREPFGCGSNLRAAGMNCGNPRVEPARLPRWTGGATVYIKYRRLAPPRSVCLLYAASGACVLACAHGCCAVALDSRDQQKTLLRWRSGGRCCLQRGRRHSGKEVRSGTGPGAGMERSGVCSGSKAIPDRTATRPSRAERKRSTVWRSSGIC